MSCSSASWCIEKLLFTSPFDWVKELCLQVHFILNKCCLHRRLLWNNSLVKKALKNGSKSENRMHLSSLNSFCSRRILCWLNEEGETELESCVRQVGLFPALSVIVNPSLNGLMADKTWKGRQLLLFNANPALSYRKILVTAFEKKLFVSWMSEFEYLIQANHLFSIFVYFLRVHLKSITSSLLYGIYYIIYL